MNSHKDETPVTRRHIAELSAGLISKYYGNNYLPYPEAPDDDHRNKSNIYAVISRNLCSPRETVCLKKRSMIQINISLSFIAFYSVNEF